MEVKFDYSDAISTANADVERTVDTPKVIPYGVGHTRDFYRGRSFRYAGKWKEHVHYLNDEYITDFVEKDGILLVCRQSNMSSSSNEPTEWVYEGDRIVAVISDYWEVVLVGGLRGKTYLPEYDEDSDSLVWRLVESDELPEEFQTYLGIKDYIDYSLVPVQEDIIDLQSDADITKRSVRALEGEVVDLGNGLTTLEVITGHISTHVEDLEGNFSDFVQTSEGFFYRVGDLENNVGQLWLTSQQFGVQMENAEGDIARLTIEADQISTRVENAEGDISQINQRADEISTQVENQQGDISRISQRADQIQSEVENQQGDISRITQRADVIESQVQNLDGDVSTISQRADQIQSQVENVEGDISTITQRADIIESQVQNQEGDISRISQTADQIQSQVENLNGDISTITQRADSIESSVSNLEGDVSIISQTADEISTRVTNAEGDISTLSQTADEISSEVTNLQGDVSTVAQKADLIESQVRTLDGDVSTISQRADSIELEVLNQQGDISDIRQTADDINLRVENVEGDVATLDVRADQITSTVADQQGQISQIRQTSTEIASEVAANKVDADNKYTETNSRITQTAAAINLEVARVEGKVDTNARTFTEALGNLQDQIDGAIDTWFYDYAPVHTDAQGVPDSQVPLNVVPYSDWAAAETAEAPEKVRDSHVSDIFYDQHSGYAYRFIGTGNPGSRVYTWVVIQDSAVIKALEDAARAQDTADNKRRVFVATPYAPYDLGDLWVKTTTVGSVAATELYRCIVAKTTAGTENIAADWAVADSYAKEVSKSNIEILSDAIIQQTLTYTYDEYGRLSNTTKSAITTGMNDISLAITGSKLETVGIFIRNASVNDNYINLIADKVRIKGTGDHTPTALGIYWDSTSQSYKISAANLQVEGAFSTTAWTDATTGQRKLVLDDAATAATGPTGYLTEALYGSGGSAASPTGGVYGTINPMTTALSNFTTITGGLILSTELILGQQSGQTWVPWAGMSGVYDNSSGSENWGHGIAAWYGGDCVDKARLTDAQIAQGWATHRWAKSLFRMDGSGYLADNNIWWGASGELHIGANTIIGNSGSVTFSQLASTVAELASYFEVVEVPSGGSYVPYLKLKGSGTGFKGFVVDGFISAGGLSSGGGTGGIDLDAMWASLTTNTDSHGTNKIHTAHLPTLSVGTGLTASYTQTSAIDTTLNLGIASGYKLPTTTEWSNKADASALGNYLPLAGGTMNNNAVISRTGSAVSWVNGRAHPIIRTTSYTGYNAILSMKTTSGSWELGVYTDDYAYLTYITDTNFSSQTNATTYQLVFPKDYGTIALTKNIPTTLPASDVYAWAKAPTKPTYNLDEVADGSTRKLANYLPLTGGTLSIGSNAGFIVKKTTNNVALIQFRGMVSGTETVLGSLGFSGADSPIIRNSSDTSYALYHAGNFSVKLNGSYTTSASFYAPTGAGTSGQVLVSSGGAPGWTNQRSLSVGSASFVDAKAAYSFTVENLPRDFDLGISAGFVNSNSGYGSYGSVLTVKTYSSGGGTLQLYAPYSPTYGGTRLKARMGNYDVSTGNSWTELKTIAWYDDIGTALANYLPLSGGTIYSTANAPLVLSTATANSYLQFYASNARKSELGYHSSYGVFLWNAVSTKMLRLQDDGGFTYDGNTIYHSGNFIAGTNYVSISGEETITGAKTFTGAILSIKYDNPRIGFYTAAGTLNGAIAYRDTVGPEIYTGSAWNRMYHSGNSNKSDVAWSASTLLLGNETSANNPYVRFVHTYNGTGYTYWVQAYQGSLWIGPYGYSNAISVTSTGNVGIGTSSPTQKLHVYGGSSLFGGNGTQYPIQITRAYNDSVAFRIGSAAASGDVALNMRISNTSSGGGNEVYIDLLSSGRGVSLGPSLSVNGNITATGAVTAGAASDARLKTNINTMSDAQAKALIMALRPVTFTWNQKATELYDQYKGNDLGFVAQEVEGVQNMIPGLSKAIGTIFADYKRLDPVKFIAPIVKVEQDHERRIHELEKAVKARDKKIEELEKRLNRI